MDTEDNLRRQRLQEALYGNPRGGGRSDDGDGILMSSEEDMDVSDDTVTDDIFEDTLTVAPGTDTTLLSPYTQVANTFGVNPLLPGDIFDRMQT